MVNRPSEKILIQHFFDIQCSELMYYFESNGTLEDLVLFANASFLQKPTRSRKTKQKKISINLVKILNKNSHWFKFSGIWKRFGPTLEQNGLIHKKQCVQFNVVYKKTIVNESLSIIQRNENVLSQ